MAALNNTVEFLQRPSKKDKAAKIEQYHVASAESFFQSNGTQTQCLDFTIKGKNNWHPWATP